MQHFRDEKAGRFYKERHAIEAEGPSGQPAFIRFAWMCGAASPLAERGRFGAREVLGEARLNWRVDRRPVLVPTSSGEQPREVFGYRALVRPDQEHVMSVVNRAYSVIENDQVLSAVVDLSRREHEEPPVLAAVSYGRDQERSFLAARVSVIDRRTVCLLAHNTHGGQGALKFQVVEVDAASAAVCIVDSDSATASVPHVGDVVERLHRMAWVMRGDTFVDRYLAETGPLWQRLFERSWTDRHTVALIEALWGATPEKTRLSPQGVLLDVGDAADRHPGYHLRSVLADVYDAAGAFTAVCAWIDNESEARERGDFTKSRVERLALGAGSSLKRRAWRWAVDNT